MRFYIAYMTFHDFFFFVRTEAQTVARPSEYIHNYALMYALNTIEPTLQRVVSSTQPFYERDGKPNPEEFAHFSIYATPAVRSHRSPSMNFKTELLSHTTTTASAPELITWNALGEGQIAITEIAEKRSYPKFGAYFKYPPLSTFTFYTIGSGPSVVRVGKKEAIARIEYQPLEVVKALTSKELTEPTSISHPVNWLDLPPSVQPRFTTMYIMKPTRLMTEVTLSFNGINGDIPAVVKARDAVGNLHWIALPNTELYRSIKF